MAKCEGYGHGILAIKDLQTSVQAFGVAQASEALLLRAEGVYSPILVAGAFSTDYLSDCVLEGISVAVDSLSALRAADKIAKKCGKPLRVHIKLDSGMHRLGFPPQKILEVINEIRGSNLEIEGIFTHFATADCDRDFLELQFNEFVREVRGLPYIIHAANSAAFLRDTKYHLDMSRIGIAAYGYGEGLTPAMKLRAKIAAVKKIEKGGRVGYSNAFIAERDTVAAIVAVGYGDGIPRCLGRHGVAFIHNKPCKIIGNICMDLLTVDISDFCGKIDVGDYAYFLCDEYTAADMARDACTIPYEIITGFSSRVRRIYF